MLLHVCLLPPLSLMGYLADTDQVQEGDTDTDSGRYVDGAGATAAVLLRETCVCDKIQWRCQWV